MMHGLGLLNLGDGTIVVGAWVNDKLQGSATVTDPYSSSKTLEFEQGSLIERKIDMSDRERWNLALVLGIYAYSYVDPAVAGICWLGMWAECFNCKTYKSMKQIQNFKETKQMLATLVENKPEVNMDVTCYS